MASNPRAMASNPRAMASKLSRLAQRIQSGNVPDWRAFDCQCFAHFAPCAMTWPFNLCSSPHICSRHLQLHLACCRAHSHRHLISEVLFAVRCVDFTRFEVGDAKQHVRVRRCSQAISLEPCVRFVIGCAVLWGFPGAPTLRRSPLQWIAPPSFVLRWMLSEPRGVRRCTSPSWKRPKKRCSGSWMCRCAAAQ